MTTADKLKLINKLTNGIVKDYDKIGINPEWFFNQFHDIMQIQQLASIETAESAEWVIKNKSKEEHDIYLDDFIEQLRKCKQYTSAVVRLQGQVSKQLPEAPFC